MRTIALLLAILLPVPVLASNADQPKPVKGTKKDSCGSGCAGTPPNCKCPTRSQRPAQPPK